MLPQVAGEQPAGDGKILVMAAGQVAAIDAGIFEEMAGKQAVGPKRSKSAESNSRAFASLRGTADHGRARLTIGRRPLRVHYGSLLSTARLSSPGMCSKMPGKEKILPCELCWRVTRVLRRREYGRGEPGTGTGAVRTPLYVYHESSTTGMWSRTSAPRGCSCQRSGGRAPRVGLAVFGPRGVTRDPPRRRERGLNAIDATCPLVTKVHVEAVRFARAGYQLILIGHEGHDEVIGTMGEAPGSITLVETRRTRTGWNSPPAASWLTSRRRPSRSTTRTASSAGWRSGSPRSSTRLRKISVMPRRTGSRRYGSSATKQTSSWSWGARTVRTATPARDRQERGVDAHLVDNPADVTSPGSPAIPTC